VAAGGAAEVLPFSLSFPLPLLGTQPSSTYSIAICSHGDGSNIPIYASAGRLSVSFGKACNQTKKAVPIGGSDNSCGLVFSSGCFA